MTPAITALATASRRARGCVKVGAAAARSLHSSRPAARRGGDVHAKYRRPAVVQTSKPELPQAPPVSAVAAAPVRREVIVEGVPIPPKPIPPGDEDCCMSGCVHCVLTIYADDLEEYNAALQEAEDKLRAKGVPESQWPEVMRQDREDVTEGSESAGTGGDPAMAAFMAFEAKLKGKGSDKPKSQVAEAKPKVDPTVAGFLALEEQLRQKRKK